MLGVAERAYITAKIYGSLVTYFAHWQAISGLDMEKYFEGFLERAVAARSRYEFDLLMVEFLV